MGSSKEKEEFLRFLRRRGQRVTEERLALLEEIFSLHGHIDADEVLLSMKGRGLKISRATVYRNLELLVESGLVRKHRLVGRGLLYEHIHPGQGHDHLVCTRCGRMIEFISPGINALQSEICRAHGFVTTQHTLQILGVCNLCASASATSAEPSAPAPGTGAPGVPGTPRRATAS